MTIGEITCDTAIKHLHRAAAVVRVASSSRITSNF